MDPTCPVGCATDLPEVLFSFCAPETNIGEIEWIYIAEPGYTFPTTLAAMTTAIEAGDIRKLHVIASKPKPTSNPKTISGGRKAVGAKNHIINLKVDETNATNHNFVRKNECSGNYQMMYETAGGKAFGGTVGMLVYCSLDMVIAESREDFIVYEGTMEWQARFTEEMAVSTFN